MVQVTVIGNDVAQSLKVLKKKMQREGVFREMKLRRCHEKSSEKKARRQAEAVTVKKQYLSLMKFYPHQVDTLMLHFSDTLPKLHCECSGLFYQEKTV